MNNYRGYRITYGRIGKGGVDGYSIYRGTRLIFSAGTFKKSMVNAKYWEFWKEQARLTVDKLIKLGG